MGNKRVLVTGATGFIGSHTVVELINAGYDVVGVDNFSNSSADVLDRIGKITGKNIDFVEVDCVNFDNFSKTFEKYPDICAAIHFAASKAVGESVDKPMLYYENNLVSLMNLIKLMNKQDSSAIVFSSSCTVYGQPDPEYLPVTEQTPFKPAQSPYGRTKQINEDILSDCVKAYEQMHVIALRYFNPIGAHSSALIGELPLGVPLNLVPYITQTAAGIREKLSIYGDDYNTPDGTCIRDYIYVCDVATAHVKAVDRMLSGKQEERFEAFNIGTGKGLSVMELVNIFMDATGVKVPYKIVDRRQGDVEQVWADSTLSNRALDWKADTPIEDVLRSAWEWEKRVRGI